MAPLEQVIDDRFELGSLAGSGGMGRVYRARDRSTGAAVALKLLHVHTAEHGERFAREARVLSKLHHPAIVGFVAHGSTRDGDAYLAMEWLEGESLSEQLARRSLTVVESLEVALQVADALGAAHHQGVVHRDLKPSNLFLCGGSVKHLKLVDFGVARLLAREGKQLTMTGSMVGTVGYMAPEQARGDPAVDARADIFALGCVLFRCVTGRAPFEGGETLEVLLRIALGQAPRPSDLMTGLPPAVDALILRMMALRPGDRPADGAAAAREIDAILRAPGGPATTAAPDAGVAGPRSVWLVLARPPAELDANTIDEAERTVRAGLAPLGAELQQMADGTWLTTVSGPRSSPDLAARAGHAALTMRAALAGAPMTLVVEENAPASLPFEAIHHAVLQLASSSPRDVRIDERAASWLRASFDCGADGRTLVSGGAPMTAPVRAPERAFRSATPPPAARADAPPKPGPGPIVLAILALSALVVCGVIGVIVHGSLVSDDRTSTSKAKTGPSAVRSVAPSSGTPASAIRPAPIPTTPARPCFAKKCAPIPAADPKRIDPIEIYPAIKRLVRQLEPSAALTSINQVGSIRDGRFDGTSSAQFLNYLFRFNNPARPPGEERGTLTAAIFDAQVQIDVTIRGDLFDEIADPTCPFAKVWPALITSGVPSSATMSLLYFPINARAQFAFTVAGHEQHARWVDNSTCTVSRTPFSR